MKSKEKSIQVLAQTLSKTWREQGALIFKVDEERVQEFISQVFRDYFAQEAELDRKVNIQLDELERSHGGQFNRHKMFPLLKKKVAEEEGFVL